jgi:O-antigen ligase
MYILRLLLITLLILLPFGELLRFSIGNDIYIKPLDILAGCISIYLIVYLLYTKKFTQTIRWQLILFPAVGLLSLAINSIWLQPNELLASSLYLVRWIAYTGVLYTVLLLDTPFKSKLIYILFGVGLSFVLFGYIQYFFYSDIRHLVFLGWDDHMYRLFSTFYDPNYASAFLVLYLLYVSGLLYRSIQAKKRLTVIILSCVLIATFLAILLTYSRSGLLMLVVASIVFLILLRQIKLILGLIVALLVYILLVSPSFGVENTNLLRTASSGARLESYANAVTIYQDKPILGVGFNAYRYAQQEYGFRKENPKYPSNADAGVDNSFLFVLATTGILGFAAFLLIWETLLSSAFFHKRKARSIFAKVFIASTLGLFVSSLFINSLFFPPLLVWLWTLFGIVHEEA